MNRVVLLGVAVFLAIVGIALLGGGANVAMAGHGCCGCCGGCDGGYCGGCNGGYGGCHGCHGGGYGCHGGGGCHGCHGGGYAYNGGGGGYAMARAPRNAPAPAVAMRRMQRQPAAFRRISFRR